RESNAPHLLQTEDKRRRSEERNEKQRKEQKRDRCDAAAIVRSVHEQIQDQSLENADHESWHEKRSTWRSLQCPLRVILHLHPSFPSLFSFTVAPV
uniref:hypothetical protein n=1 Tax=Burkholderia gladioli TaxID=28095 RepID=UPI0016419F6E